MSKFIIFNFVLATHKLANIVYNNIIHVAMWLLITHKLNLQSGLYYNQ